MRRKDGAKQNTELAEHVSYDAEPSVLLLAPIGSLDHVAGLPTRCVTLRFVYTCEKGPLVPQTKIRVMLIEPHVLEAIESVRV